MNVVTPNMAMVAKSSGCVPNRSGVGGDPAAVSPKGCSAADPAHDEILWS
jgi:hypothetical protein